MTPEQLIDETAKAAMDALFKFRPGDIVVEKTTAMAVIGEIRVMGKRTRYTGGGIPVGTVVSERVLKQCHGGIQGFYACHERDAERRGIITMHPTHAMMSYDTFVSALVESQTKAPTDWGPWAEMLGVLRTAAVAGADEK